MPFSGVVMPPELLQLIVQYVAAAAFTDGVYPCYSDPLDGFAGFDDVDAVAVCDAEHTVLRSVRPWGGGGGKIGRYIAENNDERYGADDLSTNTYRSGYLCKRW